MPDVLPSLPNTGYAGYIPAGMESSDDEGGNDTSPEREAYPGHVPDPNVDLDMYLEDWYERHIMGVN